MILASAMHRPRQGRRQPRALDAVERHQAPMPMLAGAMDGEVRHRLALAVELRPDACVVGMQALRLEARIVAADEIEKLSELLRLEAVVDVRDPGDIGSELAAPADIDGGVQAEPGAVRHRIDVALEG